MRLCIPYLVNDNGIFGEVSPAFSLAFFVQKSLLLIVLVNFNFSTGSFDFKVGGSRLLDDSWPVFLIIFTFKTAAGLCKSNCGFSFRKLSDDTLDRPGGLGACSLALEGFTGAELGFSGRFSDDLGLSEIFCWSGFVSCTAGEIC